MKTKSSWRRLEYTDCIPLQRGKTYPSTHKKKKGNVLAVIINYLVACRGFRSGITHRSTFIQNGSTCLVPICGLNRSIWKLFRLDRNIGYHIIKCNFLVSLFNGISTFMGYLMQSFPCRRTVVLLFNPYLSQMHLFENEHKSMMGIQTHSLKCHNPTWRLSPTYLY